jgi:alkyl hydroperoxide reductase subunit D
MEFLTTLKELIPDYAKDIRLNLDSTVGRSSLEGTDPAGVALAAAFAAKSSAIVAAIRASGVLSPEEINGALTAASLMAMNNTWYPWVEMCGNEELKQAQPELRMNAYATHGGVDKRRFEMYALAASIIGKCHFCVKSHFNVLQQEGMSIKQLRDVGRIAAVINAAAHVISAQSSH